MYPKITIVTPSYNQGQFLEETIFSVLNQDYPNLEYIIIDGGSTDNSVEIIKKYEDRLAYWVSEKDRGQSHAINKGLKKSNGEILNWLNSDDMLAPRAFHTVVESFARNPEADFCFGDLDVVDTNGQMLFHRKSPPYRFRTLFYGRQLGCQPTVFFRRRVLKRIGYLDENKVFCMDIDFWIRASTKGMKFREVRKTLSKARIHGDTKTAQLQKVLHEEHKGIVRSSCQWKLKEGSILEDVYYIFLNRLWRFVAALNRFIYRGDWTFGMSRRERIMSNSIDSQKLRAYYDDLHGRLDIQQSPKYSAFREYFTLNHHRCLQNYIGYGETALDLGCNGGGHIALLNSRYSNMVCGIDISMNSLKGAKNVHNTAYFSVAVAQELPFKSEIFDFILSSELMEHILPNYSQGVVNEMYRVLKKGGKILLTTPNGSELRRRSMDLLVTLIGKLVGIEKNKLLSRLYRLYTTFSGSRTEKIELFEKHGFIEHINVLTSPQLKSQLKTAGFKELYIEYDTIKPLIVYPFEKFPVLFDLLKSIETLLSKASWRHLIFMHQVAIAKK